jgi:dolichol-phosphate mannosyltransferase
MTDPSTPKLTIVIPFYNEEENVDLVLQETRGENPEAEIIAVNDGSKDRTEQIIRTHSDVRLISFPSNLGQSAALYAGLLAARGEWCALMDGDGQSHPGDIPGLVALAANSDVVCGYRVDRKDAWKVRAASRVANFIRRKVTGDGIRDAGCTLKVLRRTHIRYLIPFNQMQCYMAGMLRRAGLQIVEAPVRHRARRFGQSNYTIGGRALHGFRDLVGMHWLLARQIAWPQQFSLPSLDSPGPNEPEFASQLSTAPISEYSRP